MFKKNLFKGQSLFELVVAVSIIALMLVGIVSLASVSVRNSNFSKNNTLATKHAQEGVEWLRQQRDNSWSSFITNTDKTCLGSLDWTNVCPIPSTIFSRSISFSCYKYVSPADETALACSDPAVNKIDVTVVVSWTDTQGTHQEQSMTSLTNWKK